MFAATILIVSGFGSGTGWIRKNEKKIGALTSFWRGILFLLHPFLEATFQNAPLAANLKSRDLTVLDHSMQSSFGDFEDACGFRKR